MKPKEIEPEIIHVSNHFRLPDVETEHPVIKRNTEELQPEQESVIHISNHFRLPDKETEHPVIKRNTEELKKTKQESAIHIRKSTRANPTQLAI